PARPQLRIRQRGARPRRAEPHHHVPPPASQRDGGVADVPAIHPQRLDLDADLARLPRLRPAAGVSVARRTAAAGSAQPQRAMARHFRLHRDLADAVAADLRRRGDARRVRSQEDVQVTRAPWYNASHLLPWSWLWA